MNSKLHHDIKQENELQNLSYYNPNIKILIFRRRVVSDWKHRHLFRDPFWRLYWHPSPGVKINCDEKTFELTPDKIFLIAPETKFNADEEKPFEQFYIHFETDVPYDSCKPGIYDYPVENNILKMIGDLSQMSIENPNPNRLPSLFALTICYNMLCKIPESSLSNDFTQERIIKVTKHIDYHFSENISNDMLANIVKMNKSSFIRFFKLHTDMSPQQYICERRIRKACVLLKYSQLTIDDIAEQIGYKDRYYFSRVFKKSRNISPAFFRKS